MADTTPTITQVEPEHPKEQPVPQRFPNLASTGVGSNCPDLCLHGFLPAGTERLRHLLPGCSEKHDGQLA